MSQVKEIKGNMVKKIEDVFDASFEFGGVKVEFDSSDLETMQKFEKAIAKMAIDEKALKKDGTASERILSYCKLFEDLIDSMFGEGVFLKMCGGKYSAFQANQLYTKLLNVIERQGAANAALQVGIAQKYMPNRAARRASKQ